MHPCGLAGEPNTASRHTWQPFATPEEKTLTRNEPASRAELPDDEPTMPWPLWSELLADPLWPR